VASPRRRACGAVATNDTPQSPSRSSAIATAAGIGHVHPHQLRQALLR